MGENRRVGIVGRIVNILVIANIINSFILSGWSVGVGANSLSIRLPGNDKDFTYPHPTDSTLLNFIITVHTTNQYRIPTTEQTKLTCKNTTRRVLCKGLPVYFYSLTWIYGNGFHLNSTSRSGIGARYRYRSITGRISLINRPFRWVINHYGSSYLMS